MYVIIWEFRAKKERTTEFEKVYGRGGDWATLFERGEGYLGTELLRDLGDAGRYLTIDRWVSRERYDAFRVQWNGEYEELDRRCEALTAEETPIGFFHV